VSTYTDRLRALADLIDEYNLTLLPYVIDETDISVHGHGEGATEQIAAWRRALGGVWEKSSIPDSIVLGQTIESLPGSPWVELYIRKDHCVRRVVGTEEVVVPAVEAQPERVEVREIVEWDCEPVAKVTADISRQPIRAGQAVDEFLDGIRS